MARTSQASFGARLSRAKQLYQYIYSFPDYAPGIESLAPASFQLLISSIETTQQEHTLTHHLFAESAKERAKAFYTNEDSINKKATLLKAYVKAKFKKESQQYADVEKLVNKIRGEKPIKLSEGLDVQTISRSEKSYAANLKTLQTLLRLPISLVLILIQQIK